MIYCLAHLHMHLKIKQGKMHWRTLDSAHQDVHIPYWSTSQVSAALLPVHLPNDDVVYDDSSAWTIYLGDLGRVPGSWLSWHLKGESSNWKIFLSHCLLFCLSSRDKSIT